MGCFLIVEVEPSQAQVGTEKVGWSQLPDLPQLGGARNTILSLQGETSLLHL